MGDVQCVKSFKMSQSWSSNYSNVTVMNQTTVCTWHLQREEILSLLTTNKKRGEGNGKENCNYVRRWVCSLGKLW